ASIMGTLSGGGTHRISIGSSSLLRANAGVGISIGDDCIVEAGLYLTAGTRVTVPGEDNAVVKAAELSGQNNILFRRNSVTGTVAPIARDSKGFELTPVLHWSCGARRCARRTGLPSCVASVARRPGGEGAISERGRPKFTRSLGSIGFPKKAGKRFPSPV